MCQNRWLLNVLLLLTLTTIKYRTISGSPTTDLLGTWSSSWCSNTTMFVNNSAYHTNLNTLFRSLSSNATNNPSGFYRSTVGHPPSEVIYGHYLCRGDLKTSMCHECVTDATTTALPKTYCPNRKIALIWTGFCMVRYSNVSFFDQLDTDYLPGYFRSDSPPGNTTAFFNTLDDMMNKVIANGAAEGGSSEKFAADVANSSLLYDPTLYGYGQCTPDLTSDDCYQCLIMLKNEFINKLGGVYFCPSCILRYEIYPFLDPSYELQLPEPPQPSPAPRPAMALNPILVPSASNGKNEVSTKVFVSVVAPLLVFSLTYNSL